MDGKRLEGLGTYLTLQEGGKGVNGGTFGEEDDLLKTWECAPLQDRNGGGDVVCQEFERGEV